MGVGSGSQVHHFQPMPSFNHHSCRFMRRDGGRDKDDLLKSKGLTNLLYPPQVAEMDGIEGPSK